MPPNNVQFDTDQQQFKTPVGMNSSKKSGLIGMFIKMGWAKDESSANKILLVILIANLILIFLVIKLFL